MPQSSWKGYISFGLVSVPIRLFPAARPSHVAFHQIHKKCGTRVHQQLYCPHDKEVVSRDEIAMGYEVGEDKYVLVEPEELKKLEPRSSSAMEVAQFVKLSDVDPIYYDTSYFAVAQEGGHRGYALLVRAMSDMACAAVAKATMHQREHSVLIRPFQNGLILHTLYHPDEIHEAKGFGATDAKSIKKQELALAEQFTKTLMKPFHPEQFHDEYSDRVKQLIEGKQKGKAAPAPERAPRMAPVIDLVSALKKSLANSGKAAPRTKAKKLKKTA